MTPVVDPNSETWKAVKEFIAERLYVRRSILETANVDIAETENSRGAIEILTDLQQLSTQDEDGPLQPEVEGVE